MIKLQRGGGGGGGFWKPGNPPPKSATDDIENFRSLSMIFTHQDNTSFRSSPIQKYPNASRNKQCYELPPLFQAFKRPA